MNKVAPEEYSLSGWTAFYATSTRLRPLRTEPVSVYWRVSGFRMESSRFYSTAAPISHSLKHPWGQNENLITSRSIEDQPAGASRSGSRPGNGPDWRRNPGSRRECRRSFRKRPARIFARRAPDASVCSWISAGASTLGMPTIRPRTSDSEAEGPATSRRPETFSPPARWRSMMATGSRWTCPTIGPSSCLSKMTPRLPAKVSIPLGRTYPATSVGWYRRVFELPAADAGKRITIEFDGSYRETMVVFNGFYIGRHSGGYDPFSFDVTDFATPGGRNVLLVRVDATLSDGWFYEGAGIYRHVWLVKTSPVHVKQWGTFVSAEVRPGEATFSIRTEVNNHGKAAQNARVISTVLDPSGKAVGKAATAPNSIPEGGEQTYQQEMRGEAAPPVVARREEPLQAGDGGASRRRDRRSLRDAVSAFAR